MQRSTAALTRRLERGILPREHADALEIRRGGVPATLGIRFKLIAGCDWPIDWLGFDSIRVDRLICFDLL